MPRPAIKKDTIFVSIAAYRDPVCSQTVKSLFENATNPKNVFIGLCQQNKADEDEDCQINNEDNCNIRTIRLDNFEAKGPTWARYLCSTLWNGEEYFLQIDSHTKFVKDWDTKCIKMVKDIIASGQAKKPILSHYPREITDHDNYKDSDRQMVPRMCKAFWNTREMISFMGAETKDTQGKPYMTPYMAGGMMFSHSDFLKEVPYDPNLPYLFVGEEIGHSIRAWTHGWDIFTPTENIVFHEYTRATKPKIWTDNPSYSDMPAFDKVKYYIGLIDNDSKLTPAMKVNLDKYGLGKERTLKQYYDYAKIDVKKKTVSSNFCRENNVATENDIEQSNEKNHKKEKFTLNTKHRKQISMKTILAIIFILLGIASIVYAITHF